MRCCEMAFSSVVRTCSWLISSENVCGRYLRAMTWYMRREICENYARPRVIRGTRVKPLPLLPSGPGGVCSRPLHEARSLTTSYATSFPHPLRSLWLAVQKRHQNGECERREDHPLAR